MRGNILDFLRFVSENDELARRLGELAAEFDFEFAPAELSEDDLDRVAGGTGLKSDPATSISFQDVHNSQTKLIQTLSNILKKEADTEGGAITNIK